MEPTPGQDQLLLLGRIALALGLGLLVGLERQRAGKEVGLRTFALTALAGALSSLIGPDVVVAVLALVAVVILILNVYEMLQGNPVQVTTSVALFVTAILGILVGQGQVLVPVAAGILMTVLLAWREELVGFAVGLSEPEVRSALTLGILTFVVYPALPDGYVDPWGLVNPRQVWVIVILIAGIGFANYILLRLYGTRGIALTGFLGGVVNSSATVAELSSRDRESGGRLDGVAFRGIVLANAAMLLRNWIILALLAPAAALLAAAPIVLSIAIGLLVAAIGGRSGRADDRQEIALASPFSVAGALQFGLIFLGITIAGDLAQRLLGSAGFYFVALFGGLVSSASAVATAAALASQGKIDVPAAATGALLASLASLLVNLPLAWRFSRSRRLVRSLLLATLLIVVVGAIGYAASLAGVVPGGLLGSVTAP